MLSNLVNGECSVGPLPLLAGLVVAVATTTFGSELRITTRGSSCNVEEHTTQRVNVLAITGRLHVITWQFAVFQNAHDDSAASMSASVLRKIVTTGELLAALVTFEWLVLGMEGTVVSLEVLLASESTIADIADEGLGRILSQGLLSASAVDKWLRWGGTCIRSSNIVASVGLRRAGLAWGHLLRSLGRCTCESGRGCQIRSCPPRNGRPS
jgi:hypothetical protein